MLQNPGAAAGKAHRSALPNQFGGPRGVAPPAAPKQLPDRDLADLLAAEDAWSMTRCLWLMHPAKPRHCLKLVYVSVHTIVAGDTATAHAQSAQVAFCSTCTLTAVKQVRSDSALHWM